MIKPRDFFRVESDNVVDMFVIRELIIDNKRPTRDKYRWLFVTDDFPTDDYNMAKRFSWKEALTFLDAVDSNSEIVDFRRKT